MQINLVFSKGPVGMLSTTNSKYYLRALLLFVSTLLLVACQGQGPTTAGGPRTNVPFTPDISINEVMVAQIDHAAHFIWDAANPDLAADELDWDEVEHHAIQLISSRAALTMGGTGVNDAMWIAQRSWRDYVEAMNEASLLALTSARTADRAGLSRAGDMLIVTCEGCHQQYKPEIPTEGYSKTH